MTLTAPKHIIGHLRGGDRARAISDRREWVLANAHHGVDAVAAAIGLSTATVRNIFPGVFNMQRPSPARVAPQKTQMPRDVIRAHGQMVSVAPLPWEIEPDPRHETEPRRRGLIGGRVERGFDGEAVA